MTLAPSNINWTNRIWPIVEGCDPVSPGCLNCWAGAFVGSRLAPAEEARASVKQVPERFRGLTVVRNERHVFNGTVRFQAQLLDAPLRHKPPDRVFVAPRGDLFHEAVTDEQIAAVFGVMVACPHLTFQVLTKRAERLPQWFKWLAATESDLAIACIEYAAGHGAPISHAVIGRSWPLPNVHIGVTVDDRKHGLPRIADLRQIPAAVRWLSIEPQLEALGAINLRGIHWVVCGGESGHRARPFALEWADDVRRQCAAAGVAFWFKQAGSNVYLQDFDRWPLSWLYGTRTRPMPAELCTGRTVGLRLRHPHGEDLDELPEALRVREWPRVAPF